MEKWVVGVSGGPDSMALLDILRLKGYDCIVAHVNYNKRNSSKRDEEIVKVYCSSFNIPCEILNVTEYQTKGNFQALAREMRYDFFSTIVEKYQAQGVMIAHHQDDDLETYLFQKQRNMISDSIGISPLTTLNNMIVKRPLLDKTKQELIEYCVNRNILFGMDESNEDFRYKRNEIRAKLNMMSQEEKNELIQLMHHEKQEKEINNRKVKDQIEGLSNVVACDAFKGVEVFREWLKNNGIDVSKMSLSYLKEMLLQLSKSKGIFGFGKYIVYGQYGKIYVDCINEVSIELNTLEFGQHGPLVFKEKGSKIESLTLSEEDFPIRIRNAKNGDAIRLRFGTKSLNRHFIDNKYPLGKRKNTYVIENCAQEIVFVVGIGCDVHHYSNNSNLFVIEL